MRKARKIVEGATYHVTARANRKEFILNSSTMKFLFLSVVGRAKSKYKFTLKNFCIMGNHVHLLIRPDEDESLSVIMQWILATFAINYNKLLRIQGHVWYDRFHSTVIESLKQFLITFGYILNNPVQANLVNDPKDYRYCGLWYLRRRYYQMLEPPDDTLLINFPEITV